MHEADSFDRTEITPEGAQPDGAPDQSQEAKNPVARILDDAGAVDANAVTAWQSNSDAAKKAFYETIDRKKQLARGSSFEALTINMELGGHLLEVKPLIGHGNFDREIEERFGFRRQWRTSLIKLWRNWQDVIKAIEWAKAENRLKRSSEYSVDGALGLLKEWQHERMSGGNNAGAAKQKSYTDDFAPNKTFGNKADFIEFLKQLIYYLRADNEVLRRENAALQAELSRWNVTLYPDAPCPDQFALELPAGEVAGQ